MGNNKNNFDFAKRIIADINNETIRFDADKLSLALILRDKMELIFTLTQQLDEAIQNNAAQFILLSEAEVKNKELVEALKHK